MGDLEENKFNQKQKIDSDFKSQNQIVSDDTLTQHKCQNCGWGCSINADICENCGDWQLKGKCNFCYTDVEEGQKFCSECGNPPEGIICDSCGKLSHFDFCQQCNIALTEQANETIEMITNSVEFQNLITINDKETFNPDENAKQSDIELEKLRNYFSKFSEQNPKKKNVFSIKDNPNQNIEENLKTIEQSKQNIKTKELEILFDKQKEFQAMKLLEDIRNKTFSSNQESRKFFGALKILLPIVIQKRTPIGWKCNAYDCVHEGGPQECADPSSGGSWLYETKTETTYKQTEI
jgi:hypothetical protein